MNNTSTGSVRATNKLIPELRFPEFLDKGEWVIESLDKVVDDFIVPMRDKPKNLDGEIPWCRIEDFNGMYLSCSKSNQGVSLETVKEMNLKVYPVNTLLVSCSADLGRCAITQKPLVTNQTFIGLVPVIKKVNTVYLYYVMTNARNELNARSSGTTISYLSRQQFEKFEILLPKPNEQKKIASCLSSFDEVIIAHSQKLEALKTHKKGLMQNLFPQENETVPKWRFSEFMNDAEWVEKKLNNLGNLITGLTYSPNDIRKVGLLVLRSSNIQNGQIVLSDRVYVTPEIKGANLTKPDDILVCIRNGSKALIGKNAIIPKDIPFSTHGAFMTVFRANYPKFVFQLFQTEPYNIQVNADLGATINSINGKNFLKYKFFVPKPKEQQKIADCLSSLDTIIKVQTEKIEQLKLHKMGLMQRMFPKVID